MTLKTFNGLDSASVKTINGLARASVKTVNGLSVASTPATLYEQADQNTYSNFNWNGATDKYAWRFTATATGVPALLSIWLNGISGTPTGNLYIKADRTAASTTYGTATGVTFTSSAQNDFTLTGGSSITSGNSYWVYFERTSNSSNVPQIQYDTGKTNHPLYRSSSANIDPNTLWFTNDVKMKITT